MTKNLSDYNVREKFFLPKTDILEFDIFDLTMSCVRVNYYSHCMGLLLVVNLRYYYIIMLLFVLKPFADHNHCTRKLTCYVY